MRIGNVEFFSKAEYMAGLRDSGRIELLKQKTDINNPLAAAALFRELKSQPFYFETAVGKEFMKELVRKTKPSERGLCFSWFHISCLYQLKGCSALPAT